MSRPTTDELVTSAESRKVGALASRFPATAACHPTEPAAIQTYIERLDQALHDETISGAEGWQLEDLARSAGLNQQALTRLHREAWNRAGLVAAPTDPESISRTRRRKLLQLAHDLGHPDLAAQLSQLETASSLTVRAWLVSGWRLPLIRGLW